MIHSYNNLQGLSHLKKDALHIQNISLLINSLQKERGYSSGYLGSHGTKFQSLLRKQQQNTDSIYAKIIFLHEDYSPDKKTLAKLRKKVQSLSLSTIDAFNEYTKIIYHLLQNHLMITKTIKEKEIEQMFHAYTNLLFMKEAAGKMRGSLSGLFAQKKQNYQLVFTAMHAKGEYDLAQQNFLTYASDEMMKEFHTIAQGKNYQWLQNVFKKYTKHQNISVTQDPNEWFDKATAIIEAFNRLQKLEFANINSLINKYASRLKIELIINIFLLVLITLIMLLLGVKIKNSILRNLKLLSEYKNAVDRSSIVSKTDRSGRITYVNDKFCIISGYTKEELLGKPHNIVRHKDMPKSLFRDMWHTVLEKRAWSGVIKNRKKDGSSYIVEVTISPILNERGEIEEFIAIRNDITQILQLHKEIEETQEDIILKMGEIGETRSQETGFHVKRVALYSQILAKHYGLGEKETKYLTIASPMHDIGKVAIPDHILNKKGKLTQEEWKVMKTHAEIGYQLFKNSQRELLKTAAVIAYEHHEKYDGSGYPRGLRGKNIHIYGRITALADVFDALGSERCYKKAWDDERIFKLIQEEKGKHFDPELVDIFFEHLDEFLHVRDSYNDMHSYTKV
ncbi:nitrate- and nitrite sensing domain-containing protein [Sulfurimonas sp. NW15]|uniref:HD domain-containing phosphohydrolase n=1 Tax=Sulfurimonas TaxID=202746 RepID=UPI00125ED2E8|nr:HD domain-containing phosphohydrolase [Sulfurimonas hydrogeniphila]